MKTYTKGETMLGLAAESQFLRDEYQTNPKVKGLIDWLVGETMFIYRHIC
jgi:hypothetical protein